MKRVPIARNGYIQVEIPIKAGNAIEFVLESGLSIPTVVVFSDMKQGCGGCVFRNIAVGCPKIYSVGYICKEQICVFLPVEQLI